MYLQLRVLRGQEFDEGETYRFRGSIIRLSWESDGRLLAGRSRRPLLIFYPQESGCRVRCVPAESLNLNGLPLEREHRLSSGDHIERADGLTIVVTALNLKEDREEVFVIANQETKATNQVPALSRLLVAVATCAVVLGSIFGSLQNSTAVIGPLQMRPAGVTAVADRTVREVALELKETLSQASESRDTSVEELLVALASARRIAQQLGRLHSEDALAVTVATAVNSFYQLSAGIVAEDPVAFQAALDSSKRCLEIANADRRDALVLFYRSLADISNREAQTRLTS